MAAVRSVLRFIARNAKRVVVTIAGFVVILIGAVLALPGIPGPGFVIIFGGLAILATEYVWAQRALEKLKAKASRAAQKVRRPKPNPGEPTGLPKPDPAEDPSA